MIQIMKIFNKIIKVFLDKQPIGRNYLLIFYSFIFLFFLSQNFSFAKDLEIDLSEDFVSLTTDFKGSKIVLFGSAQEGNDLAIVVRGPKQSIKVRKKEKVKGIWLNKEIYEFSEIPSYYSVISNRDLKDFLTQNFIERYQLSESSMKIYGKPIVNISNSQENYFRMDSDASLRKELFNFKKDLKMYSFHLNKINFVGNNLFRTDISFDPGVLTGKYEINVLEFKDGKIADSKLLDLEVSKSGIEAYIFDFAHGKPLAYGFIAVLIAFFAGIFADFVFRRI